MAYLNTYAITRHKFTHDHDHLFQIESCNALNEVVRCVKVQYFTHMTKMNQFGDWSTTCRCKALWWWVRNVIVVSRQRQTALSGRKGYPFGVANCAHEKKTWPTAFSANHISVKFLAWGGAVLVGVTFVGTRARVQYCEQKQNLFIRVIEWSAFYRHAACCQPSTLVWQCDDWHNNNRRRRQRINRSSFRERNDRISSPLHVHRYNICLYMCVITIRLSNERTNEPYFDTLRRMIWALLLCALSFEMFAPLV